MENTDKKTILLWRLAIGAVLFFVAGLLITAEPFRTITYAAAIIITGFDIVKKSKRLNEWSLCGLTALTLFVTGRSSGAFSVVFFFRTVKYIEERCAEKSRTPLDLLQNLRSQFAYAEKNGEYIKVPIREIKKDDVIVVKAGERVPLDGIIVTGESFMDMRAFTGEAAPREVRPGDHAISGAINFGSTLYIRVTHNSEECSTEKILRLTHGYDTNKTDIENRLDKAKKLLSSWLISVFAMLIFIAIIEVHRFLPTLAYRTIIVISVLSPHIILASVSGGFKAAISGCGIDGILFGGGKYIEQLAKSKTPKNEIVINANDPAAAVEETMNSGKTAVITNEPRLERAISAARRTVNTVRINIIITILVKLAIIVLAILGHIGIWGAVAADAIVSIIILTNSTRTGKK